MKNMKFHYLVIVYAIGGLITIASMILSSPQQWDLFWYGRDVAIGYDTAGLLVPALFGGGVLTWSIGYALVMRKISLNRMSVSDVELRRFYIVTLVLVGLLMLLPPILSLDMVYYYQQGWVTSVKDANPYLFTAASFADAPGLDLTGFKPANLVSPYSPLWNHIAALFVTLSGGSLWVGTLLFKLLATAALIACPFLVRRVLEEVNPSLSRLGFVVVAANPLIMIESATSGHSEIAAITAVMLGLWLLLRDPLRPWLGLLAISSAILLKTSAAPALVVAGLWVCRDIWAKKLSWSAIPKSALLIVMLFTVVITPFWIGLMDLPRLFGLNMVSGGPYKIWAAPANLAKDWVYYLTQVMGTGITREVVDRVISITLTAVTLLCILYFSFRSSNRGIRLAGLAPIYVIGTVLQVYWRQWYVLWSIAFISLAPRGVWLFIIWCYSVVALLSYLLTNSAYVYCCR